MVRSAKPRKLGRPDYRKPLTKTQLLPVPATIARDLSLRNHLTLAALSSNAANIDLIGQMFKVLYGSYFIDKIANHQCDLDLLLCAERLLHHHALAVKAGISQALPKADVATLAQILARHDRQLAAMPAHVIEQASEQMGKFLLTEALSPFPAHFEENA